MSRLNDTSAAATTLVVQMQKRKPTAVVPATRSIEHLMCSQTAAGIVRTWRESKGVGVALRRHCNH
jgi:hypothetical protein